MSDARATAAATSAFSAATTGAIVATFRSPAPLKAAGAGARGVRESLEAQAPFSVFAGARAEPSARTSATHNPLQANLRTID
jgi:hypothetical protein